MTMKLIQIVLLYPTQYLYKKINNQIFNNPVIYKLRFLPVFRRFQFITFFPNRICIVNYLFLFLPQYQDTLKRHRSLTKFLQAPQSCAIFCTSFQFLPILFMSASKSLHQVFLGLSLLFFPRGFQDRARRVMFSCGLSRVCPPPPHSLHYFFFNRGLACFLPQIVATDFVRPSDLEDTSQT